MEGPLLVIDEEAGESGDEKETSLVLARENGEVGSDYESC